MAAGSTVLTEVCVDSVVSALAAERGGAGRVELCSGLIEGGITPSAGLIEAARAATSIPVHVMIRPRGGDFLYDDHEIAIMRRDIEVAKQSGANGVVFGILLPDGKVDILRTRRLVEFARPLSVTFHRAFDMTADPFQSLEDVCATGADRVLTSGGEPTVQQGRGVIVQLVRKAETRIIVMPGSGIKAANARAIVRETGAREIHVGLRSCIPSPMNYRNTKISMGSATGHEYERYTVLEQDVRDLCTALKDR